MEGSLLCCDLSTCPVTLGELLPLWTWVPHINDSLDSFHLEDMITEEKGRLQHRHGG